jgi:hypothetical protein
MGLAQTLLLLRSGDGSHGAESSASRRTSDPAPLNAVIGLAVPGRRIRSLVAEDRSAAGVRDQTGPAPPMLTRLLTERAATPGMSEHRMGRRRGIRPAWRPSGAQERTGQQTACAIYHWGNQMG